MADRQNYKLDEEESEILEKFEREELVPVLDVEKEIEFARRAARHTLNKMSRNTGDGSEISSD